MIFRTAASAARLRVDALLIPVVSGIGGVPPDMSSLDERLAGGLAQLLGAGLGARLGEVSHSLTLGRLPATRIALVGLGATEQVDRVRLGNALRLAIPKVPGPRTSVAVAFSAALLPGIDPAGLAEAATEALVLSGFDQASHRSRATSARGKSAAAVERLTLTGFPRIDRGRLETAVVLAEATNRARALVNAPPSELTPSEFAAQARREASAAGLRYQVLDERELRRRRYGAILAAGAGSAQPPRFVVLTYRPAGAATKSRRRLAMVGKGITFDTGGISIKPAADMQYMKADMGGAAAVLGAMTAIGRLKPRVEVIGILCLAENMVSGSSMRPGDVIRAGSGTTIEVVNTDAEGRLVLADGIHHAVGLGATDVVDIATLTGGQRIALGPVAAAVQSDTPELLHQLLGAADAAGERVWVMPTFPEYETMLESRIADLNNSPGGNGSAITAGLFLRRFAGGKPWLHMDIAAPSWNRIPSLTEIPSGPSGFGVRTLARLALGMGAKS